MKRGRSSSAPPPSAVARYERGAPADVRGVADRKIKRSTLERERALKAAASAAAAAELLLPGEAGTLEAEGPMERTYQFSQAAVSAAVGGAAAKRGASLSLGFGPYRVAYTRSGRHMVLGGARGHLAVVDWNRFKLGAEFNAGEVVRDVCFFHNESLFAAAQQRYVHVYDHTGAEVHVMRGHQEPLALEFLPYHFLLASVGRGGYLKYQDVSTGALVAEHRTRLGPCAVLRQNPWNAVLCAGHAGGAVTMWTPNMSTPVATLAAHRGAVTALAVDPRGTYLVSAGADARVKVWDVRRWAEVHDYFTPVPATALDVSGRGLVGVGYGSHVAMWGRDFALPPAAGALGAPLAAAPGGGSGGGGGGGGRAERLAAAAAAAGAAKARDPYMRHELPGSAIASLRFRPFDDVAAIGHSGGVASMLVPGAGEPNFDSAEADPFQGRKAKREAEVRALLDKIPATMIALDPAAVAAVDAAPRAVREREAREDGAKAAAAAAEARLKVKGKKRRGIRKMLKKAGNVVSEQRLALEAKLKEQQEERREKDAAAAGRGGSGGGGGGGVDGEGLTAKRPSALSRFY
jgi:U3 small nucleolar RNA-associated protein 7